MTKLEEFLKRLNGKLRPNRTDIIEKDFHLHRLLHEISKDDYLSSNVVFKGGTCLIKAHIGYFRFSEDVDFTWKDKGFWKGRTSSQTRKKCSKEIDLIIDHIVPIAKELGLKFNGDKSDKDQVIIGGGGRMPRFYLSYPSVTIRKKAKLKIEINFVEKTLFPYQKRDLASYIGNLKEEELEMLFEDEYREYTSPIKIECYDPREIFTDKCRAALTRVTYKLRDIIDIIVLQKQNGYSIPQYSESILDKTIFMLDMYAKYRDNLETKELPEAVDVVKQEMDLLINRPEGNIEKDIDRIHKELEQIQKLLT